MKKKQIPCDFPDGSCKELVRHMLGSRCFMSVLRGAGWSGPLGSWRAEGICCPDGHPTGVAGGGGRSGGGCVPKSARQALRTERVLNQTDLVVSSCLDT